MTSPSTSSGPSTLPGCLQLIKLCRILRYAAEFIGVSLSEPHASELIGAEKSIAI